MSISPRLTRAALTFLLFGTVAALLPSQDTTALADIKCGKNPQYVMRLATIYTFPGNPSEAPSQLTIYGLKPATLFVHVSTNGGTKFQQATDANFSGRTLTFTLKNTGTFGRFNMGSNSGTNSVMAGQSVNYSPASTANSTGFYASGPGMSGTVSVKFAVNGITLVDSRTLTSQ